MANRTWNGEVAKDRIAGRIREIENVVVRDYVRETELSGLRNGLAYRVDGVHLYVDILNMDEMLGVTNYEGPTAHRRTLACALTLDSTEGAHWVDPEIPSAFDDNGSPLSGFVLSIAGDDPRHAASRTGATQSARELRASLLGNGAPAFTESEILVINRGENIRAVYLTHEKDAIWEFALVPPDPGTRLPSSHATLAEKSVGLLGCGSVGSKVASMLARAGVHKFVLVDDDVLRPENLVRNELDWEDVGVHKADAVAGRVKLLQSQASVDVRRQRLGGQESAGSFAGVMTALSRCDLIIDASGDDTAFNYAADIAGRYARPMVWARVFGGGFGGMLVRFRPGVDPSPQVARARIEQWCAERDVPLPPQATRSYEAVGDDGPMVADDADVSVLASHLARLAIDTLLSPESSVFEQSAYMLGLRREWIFAAVFDTWPIDIGPPEDRPSEDSMAEADRKEAVTSLVGLLTASDDHASS